MTRSPETEKKDRTSQGASRVLNVGLVLAFVLAASCLFVTAFYLFKFLRVTTQGGISELTTTASNVTVSDTTAQLAIQGRTVIARIVLLSCGIFAGLSFGFLGFGLFLMGIKGEIGVEAQAETHQLKIARLAPGAFVILVAAVLIGVCATRETPFIYKNIESTSLPETGNQHLRPGPGPDQVSPRPEK